MKTPYTTEDFRNNIQVMEDEGLPLDAPVEISIRGKIYHVTSIGHFHVEPNRVIELETEEA